MVPTSSWRKESSFCSASASASTHKRPNSVLAMIYIFLLSLLMIPTIAEGYSGVLDVGDMTDGEYSPHSHNHNNHKQFHQTLLQQPSLMATKSPTATKNCTTSQKTINALHDFYDAAGGSGWIYPPDATGAQWDFQQSNPDPCQQHWQGLTCTSQCLISSIYLPGYNLAGTITTSINQLASSLNILAVPNNPQYGGILPLNFYTLTNLLVLDLHGNSFSGSLLYNIINLNKLVVMKLYDNKFVGALPSSFSSLSSLQIVDFHNNAFTGSLPASLSSLTALSYLDFSNNVLSGNLPDSVTSLTKLQTLDLAGNRMGGPLPVQLGKIRSLRVFDITNNGFTGYFPIGFNSSNQLTKWKMSNNKIQGSISADFYQCLSLSLLDISYNKITGPLEPLLPNGQSSYLLGNFQNLTNLYVEYNKMTSTIPLSLLSLSNLSTILLNDNFFDGTIPNNIGYDLKALSNLTLTNNMFTGPFPDSLFNVHGLTSLSMGGNAITGTIPITIGSLLKLTELALFDTHMTGGLPTSLSGLQSLVTLDLHQSFFDGDLSPLPFCTKLTSIRLDGNLFSDTIPNDLNVLKHLELLRLDNNMMTGVIPSNLLFNSIKLQYLNVSTNRLIGTIPQALSTAIALEVLDLSNNALNGTLGTMVSELTQLSIFYVNDNLLTGDLSGLVAGTSSSSALSTASLSPSKQVLSQIDVSNNQLSGSIPTTLFQLLPNLTAVNLMKNCLTGSLSSSYCSASRLQILVMDGIHSAESCEYHDVRNDFKHYDSDDYSISKPLTGSIPSCLFTLPNIQTLHFAGNGIEGSLPDSLSHVSSSLLDLTICHNQLTGSIPTAIQTHPFAYMDLSYNRFFGTLNSNFNPVSTSSVITEDSAVVELEMNRLSGRIPSTLLNIKSVNVLHGNMYACDLSKESTQLPKHDQYVNAYECGSNTIDNTFYAWLIFLGFVILVLVSVRVAANRFNLEFAKSLIQTYQESCFLYWEVYNSKLTALFYNKHINYLHEYGDNLTSLRKWSLIYTITVTLICMPLYVAFTYVDSTYTNTYIWQVSLGFLSGKLPTYIVMVLFALIVIVFDLKNGFIHIEMFLPKQMSLLLLNHVMNVRQMSVESAIGSGGSGSGMDRSRIESTAAATYGSGGTVVTESTGATTTTTGTTNGRDSLFSRLCCITSNDINWYCSIVFFLLLNFVVIVPITIALVYADVTPVDRSLATLYSFLYTIAIIYWDDVVLPNYVARWLSKIYMHYYPVVISSSDKRSGDRKASSFDPPPIPLMINDPYAPKPIMTANSVGRSTSTITDTVMTFKQLEKQRASEADAYIVQLLSILMICNSIAVPVIVVAIMSPDCFYNALATPNQEEVQLILNVCNGLSSTVASLIEHSTYYGNAFSCLVAHTSSYTPPYYYRYQCSSRFLTIFTPIYLYRYFFAGFLLPMFQMSMKMLQEYLAKEYGPETKLIPYINVFLPSTLIPLSDDARKVGVGAGSNVNGTDGAIVPRPISGQPADGSMSGSARNTNTSLPAHLRMSSTNPEIVAIPDESMVNIDDSYNHGGYGYEGEEDDRGGEEEDDDGYSYDDEESESDGQDDEERPSNMHAFEIESVADEVTTNRSNSRPSSSRLSDRFSFGITTRLSEGFSLSYKPNNNNNPNNPNSNVVTTRGSLGMSFGNMLNNNSFSVSNSFHQQVNASYYGNGNSNNNVSTYQQPHPHHQTSQQHNQQSPSFSVASSFNNPSLLSTSAPSSNPSLIAGSQQLNSSNLVIAHNQYRSNTNSQRSASNDARTISLGSSRPISVDLESVDFSNDDRGSLQSVAIGGTNPSIAKGGKNIGDGPESDNSAQGFGGRLRQTIAGGRAERRGTGKGKGGKRRRRPTKNNTNANRGKGGTQYDQLFDSRGIAISLLHDILLMFTFGTLFPPLCVIACCVIIVKTLYQQLLLGRLVVLSRSNKNKILQGFVKHIDQECGKIRARIRDSSYFMPFFATMIWSFFLFDVYGNSEGYSAAIWVISLVAVPIVLFSFRKGREYYLSTRVELKTDDNKETTETGKDNKPGDGEGDSDEDEYQNKFGTIGNNISPSKREQQEHGNSRSGGMFLRASQQFKISPVLGMNGFPAPLGSPVKLNPVLTTSAQNAAVVGESTVNPMATASQTIETGHVSEKEVNKDNDNFDDVEVEDLQS